MARNAALLKPKPLYILLLTLLISSAASGRRRKHVHAPVPSLFDSSQGSLSLNSEHQHQQPQHEHEHEDHHDQPKNQDLDRLHHQTLAPPSTLPNSLSLSTSNVTQPILEPNPLTQPQPLPSHDEKEEVVHDEPPQENPDPDPHSTSPLHPGPEAPEPEPESDSSPLRASSRLVATEERQSDYSTAQIVVLAAVFAGIYLAWKRISEAQWRRLCRQLVEFLRKRAIPSCCDLFLYVQTRGKALKKLARSRSASWTGSSSVSDIFSRAKGRSGVRAKDDLPSVELTQKPRGRFQPELLVPESPAGNIGSSSRFRSILSDENIASLVGSLPRRYAIKNWQLVYASELHGYSLYTAYRKFAARRAESSTTPGFFLAVMDANQHVFGAFATEMLQVNSTYFGTGESFLAKLHPEFATFRWTGKNSQFVLAKEDMLAFGGGGKFALWLDSSFEKGTSDAGSPTFDNPCIASVEHFKCVSVEIWGFTNASKLPKLKGFMRKSGV